MNRCNGGYYRQGLHLLLLFGVVRKGMAFTSDCVQRQQANVIAIVFAETVGSSVATPSNTNALGVAIARSTSSLLLPRSAVAVFPLCLLLLHAPAGTAAIYTDFTVVAGRGSTTSTSRYCLLRRNFGNVFRTGALEHRQ